MLQTKPWGVSGSLQEYDGIKHPVMYASKTLLLWEQNYCVAERDALAIAVSSFHRFLYGQHFVLEVALTLKNPRLM